MKRLDNRTSNLIRAALAKRGLNQSRLADKVSMDAAPWFTRRNQSSISNMLGGREWVDAEDLAELMRVLDLTDRERREIIRAWNEEPERNDEFDIELESEVEHEAATLFLAVFRKVDPAIRDILLAQVRAVDEIT